MVKVFFPLQNQEIHVPSGETVAAACSRLGFNLDLVCGGKGTCKKCQVKIEEGGKSRLVLACQKKVSHGMKVFLNNDISAGQTAILSDHALPVSAIKPSCQKIYLEKEKLQTPFFAGSWEHIKNNFTFAAAAPSLSLLQKLARLLNRENDNGLTFVFWNDRLLDIEEGDTSSELYGLAVDLGSTSIVAYLYDLNTGQELGSFAALNAQISEGADVISRIMATLTRPEGIKRLQQKAVDTLNNLIHEAVQAKQLNPRHIYTMVIGGNSAMQHLFLGLHPGNLGRTPYSNIILSDTLADAHELELDIHPQAVVHFLPLIGGFVGADTTAVLMSLSEKEREKPKLILDLGTNGEILLGCGDRWLAASTAAGPALEGANIRFGMRGTLGAIEKVKLTGDKIELQVIGDTEPIGICGSGIVDAVAEMRKVGLINKQGKMLSAEEYGAICPPEHRHLAAYLDKLDNINVFYLTGETRASAGQTPEGKRICITQKDIRAVQLAKSAIYTGCLLLIQAYGLKGEDLDEILIAGAFGNYINIDNAQYIGLFPSFEHVPVRSIGNAAGAGVISYLLSKDLARKTEEVLRSVSHFDLASHPEFQKNYLKNTEF